MRHIVTHAIRIIIFGNVDYHHLFRIVDHALDHRALPVLVLGHAICVTTCLLMIWPELGLELGVVEQSVHQSRSGLSISGDRNIVHVGESGQSLDVSFVRMRRQRVSKEEDRSHLAARPGAANFLVSAKRSTRNFGFHFQGKLGFERGARASCGNNLASFEEMQVSPQRTPS